MKRILLGVFLAALLAASCVAANANGGWQLFVQDNFYQYFGLVNGNPQEGAAGATISAYGLLKSWSAPSVLYWFDIVNGIDNVGAYPIGGGEYKTDYAADLKIYSDSAKTNLVWEGSGGVYTRVFPSGTQYDATAYDRPGYESQPAWFQSVGAGYFNRTTASGSLAGYHAMDLQWMGTYNWGDLHADPLDESSTVIGKTGNVQGKLVPVPEPMTVLLGIMGLGSVAGFRRLRKS